MSGLLELAARVEALAGPDRESDCLIYEMDCLRKTGVKLNLTPKMRATYYGEPDGRYFDLSGPEPVELPYQAGRYTASLDAAVMVVPEGCDWGAGLGVDDADGVEGWAWCGPDGEGPYTFAKTPALALTAAALKARSATLAQDATS